MLPAKRPQHARNQFSRNISKTNRKSTEMLKLDTFTRRNLQNNTSKIKQMRRPSQRHFGPKFGSPRWTSTMSLTTLLKPYKFQCFSSCWPSCCQYFIRRVQKTSLGTAGGKLYTPLAAKSNPRRQVLPLLLNSPLEPLVGEPTVREKTLLFYNVCGTAVSLGQKNVTFIQCSELRTKKHYFYCHFGA